MASRQPRIKYNPAIRGDDELVRCFVVRLEDFELTLRIIRENTAAKDSPNQHVLFVGPRGSGKTMLVGRVAAELRRKAELAEHWFPIVFGEECERITSAGEFWLEALFYVADQTGDSSRMRIYEDLKLEADAQRLRDRALSQLLDFAGAQGKRLLLVVENLNDIFAEQLPANSDWDLRHTLQNEPRIMLLGTATSSFEISDHIDQAWYELLATYDLEPLNLEECTVLWRSVTGAEPRSPRVRAVQILTGASPRLLTILAGFATNRSFRELMDQLVELIVQAR